MSSFWLTWDESAKPWGPDWGGPYYVADVLFTAGGGREEDQWSFGGRQHGVTTGDRVYLFRVGVARGLVASGRIVTTPENPTGAPFLDAHWDDERAERGDQALYVALEWDAVIPVNMALGEAAITAAFPDEHVARLQAGGVEVKPANEAGLEQLWQQHRRQIEPDIRAGLWARVGRCPNCGAARILGVEMVCPACRRPIPPR